MVPYGFGRIPRECVTFPWKVVAFLGLLGLGGVSFYLFPAIRTLPRPVQGAILGLFVAAAIGFGALFHYAGRFPVRDPQSGAWLWKLRRAAKKEAEGRLHAGWEVSDEGIASRMLGGGDKSRRPVIPPTEGGVHILRGAVVQLPKIRP